MSDGKGRHVDDTSTTFGRDLAIMVVGIVVVGAVVFGALWMFARATDSEPAAVTTSTSPAPETTTTTAVTTSSSTTTTTTAPATTSTTSIGGTEVRDPSEITVLVLNAVGTPGLAGRLTEQLSGLGYVTLQADDYDPPLDQSRVWYRTGFAAEALELAAQVPDALIELNPDADTEADIVVVLGASFQE